MSITSEITDEVVLGPFLERSDETELVQTRCAAVVSVDERFVTNIEGPTVHLPIEDTNPPESGIIDKFANVINVVDDLLKTRYTAHSCLCGTIM